VTSLKRVCVYCGSRDGSRPAYVQAARDLGAALAGRGIGLVYGGGRIGLMGAVADAVLAAGGSVTGVIPRALVSKEVAHLDLKDLRIVGSMHERKALMAELSDAFIALPGGMGTLEELFEILAWAQLRFHQKPCGLLNVEKFYDPLLSFLDHAVSERFIPARLRASMLVETDSLRLLDSLANGQLSK
jgi:uncharacterized protein (TIGR00730 family)